MKNNIITIVTPTFNSEEYLAETIESIIFQKGNFYIDYIIKDGKSTDSTLDIINHYESFFNRFNDQKTIMGKRFYLPSNRTAGNTGFKSKNPLSISCLGISYNWISEKDAGPYSAIKKGFTEGIGAVCGWLNSDDYYLQNAFSIVMNYFEETEKQWLVGQPGRIDENGHYIVNCAFTIYLKKIVQRGLYNSIDLPCLQQESMFWKKELYDKAGGISEEYKIASDYDLWVQFSKYASLSKIPHSLAGFRRHAKQRSLEKDYYQREVKEIIQKNNLKSSFVEKLYCKSLDTIVNRSIKKRILRMLNK